MPWQDNSGNNGSGKGPVRGPWGQPPRPPGGGDNGSGRGEPPDLEELLQASRQRFKRAFPPRNGGGGGGGTPQITPQLAGLIAAGVLVLWAFRGVYQVNTAERAVVTTFGNEHDGDRAGPALGTCRFPFRTPARRS
ncbi:MAG: protease modulator HflK N-terminal domain-containing protein [Parvularculaceae bacterium]